MFLCRVADKNMRQTQGRATRAWDSSVILHLPVVFFTRDSERFFIPQVLRTNSGLGMSRAQYYWRQADICMRLSLLSDDNEVAELLINKAMVLMSQAESAATQRSGDAIDGENRGPSSGDLDGHA